MMKSRQVNTLSHSHRDNILSFLVFNFQPHEKRSEPDCSFVNHIICYLTTKPPCHTWDLSLKPLLYKVDGTCFTGSVRTLLFAVFFFGTGST